MPELPRMQLSSLPLWKGGIMGTPSGLLITNANVDLREIGIIKRGVRYNDDAPVRYAPYLI
jgi:hypothetical protein